MYVCVCMCVCVCVVFLYVCVKIFRWSKERKKVDISK